MSSEKYRSTLNLFQTNFPIKADSCNSDLEIQNMWKQADIFSKINNNEFKKKDFILHDGPPYANGPIHLGHAYNYIFKDIVGKAKRMMGYYVNIIPGWDCHGLPIEQKVSRDNPHLNKFQMKKACRDYAFGWVENQKESFKKLGIFMDWDNPYLTMNYKYQADIMRAFASLVGDGYISRSNKTIPWCMECKTALASAEIEYQERKDPSIYVLFELENKGFFKEIEDGSVYCMIWTTTPWTLPLNRAIMLKKEGSYLLAESEGKYLIFGKGCLDFLTKTTNKVYKIIKEIKSQDLKDCLFKHPFDNNLLVKIVYDDSVEDKEGTACVHTAPGCGPIDYEIGIKNGLEIYSPISDDGKYSEKISPKELLGMSVLDGQIWVIKKLHEGGSLWFKTSIRHSYPHCWRCKNGLIFRATPQWFCNLEKDGFKNKVSNAIENINFFPASGKNFLKSTVSNRWEWCLSRQRVWGIPIVALLSNEDNSYFIDANFIKNVAGEVEKGGIEYWDNVSMEDLSKFINDNISIEKYRKETNILDVWFDSGVSHMAVLKDKNQYPADVYLEGIDQHRGWFQSSLLTSVAIFGKAPMKNIVTHGFTVDEKGQKMSKSIGNVIDPQDIVKKYGTDGLRLWVSSVDNDGDLVASSKLFENISEVYRKIRNTQRFILQNIVDFNYKNDSLGANDLLKIDLYVIKKTYEVQIKALNAYNNYRLTDIFHLMSDFCASFLSSFYFDISKDILYCEKKDSRKRRSCQTALYLILDAITKVMAPIMSHTSDLVFQNYKNENEVSVHLSEFNRFELLDDISNKYYLSNEELSDHIIKEKLNFILNDSQEKEQKKIWDAMFDLRNFVFKEIEKLRADGIVKQSMESSVFIEIGKNYKFINEFNKFKDFIKDEFDDFIEQFFIVSEIKFNLINSEEEKDLKIEVKKHNGNKCPRCWKWFFGGEEICNRCKNAL
jgi:isoleucyl-tRNA synthetase